MPTLIEQAHSRQWFYSYQLPDGSTTPTYHGIDIQSIHDTRWSMLNTCLAERLGEDRSRFSAVDLASHQGWFAVNLAQSGFGRVQGIEARESHIEDSRLVADIYGLDNLNTKTVQSAIDGLKETDAKVFQLVVVVMDGAKELETFRWFLTP